MLTKLRDNGFKYKNVSFYLTPGLTLKYGLSYEDNIPYICICLFWGKFYFYMPWMPAKICFTTEEQEAEERGFTYFDKSFLVYLKSGCKVLHLPFVNHIFEYRKVWNGSEWIEPEGYLPKPDDNRLVETHSYIYIREDGSVQNVNATVCMLLRRWHRKWLPFLKLEKITLEVLFDSEVGERTGTWKGGVIGCDYEMKKGESMEQCLRRMERERKL